jgi:hypothetical protein
MDPADIGSIVDLSRVGRGGGGGAGRHDHHSTVFERLAFNNKLVTPPSPPVLTGHVSSLTPY